MGIRKTSDHNKIPAIIAGILLYAMLLHGNYQLKHTNTNNSGHRIGTIQKYQKTPSSITQSSVNGRFSNESQLVRLAEDEYWEIESIDGIYYRVRREDWEEIEGGDGTQLEERIGNIEDLKDYIRNQGK